MQGVQAREWRRYGFGGPPQPWEHNAQRDLDRLATSYYLDALEQHRRAVESTDDDFPPGVDLAVISGLVDDVTVESTAAGSVVRLSWPVLA